MTTKKLTITALTVLLGLLTVGKGSIFTAVTTSTDVPRDVSNQSCVTIPGQAKVLPQDSIHIGEVEPINLEINYLNGESWTQTINYPDATFIKVHFLNLDLLPNDYVTVSDPTGVEVYTYPNVSDYTTDRDEGFWAISVTGDTAVIELHSGYEGEALGNEELQQFGVVIDKYGRGYSSLEFFKSIVNPQDVCGTDQRKDVVCYQSSHPTEYSRANAVSMMLRPIGGGYYSLCTAWRVGPNNRLFVNEHCITNQVQVRASEFWFNYQRAVCGSGTDPTPGMITKVTGNTLLTDDYTLDFALFMVNDFSSIAPFGHLNLDVRTPILGEEIYIPQHSSDILPKHFGIESDQNNGNICRIDNAIMNGRGIDTDIGYLCDTAPGSSGSPVLARSSHRVIALHHLGGCNNQGVRIDQIWSLAQPYLESPLVKVTITRFIQKERPDPYPYPTGEYYAAVTINGVLQHSNVEEKEDFRPEEWVFVVPVDWSLRLIPVNIRIMDEDHDADDHIDINPRDRVTSLDITLDLETGTWIDDSGRLSPHSSEGDGDEGQVPEGGQKGEVFFDIEVIAPTRGPIIVTSSSGGIGGPDCTLRDAITAANTNTPTGSCSAGGFGGDTILLQAAGPYTLTEVDPSGGSDEPTGLPSITSKIIITHHKQFTVIRRSPDDNTPNFRILHVAAGGDLTLNKIIVDNGRGVNGGGIFNRGTVKLTGGSGISGLSINKVSGNGGGIYNTNRGTVILENTTVLRNEAGSGGGIYNTSGTVEVTNSIISSNSASGDGGGIRTGGDGTVDLTNSTVSGNSASGDGGGIFTGGDGTVEVTNSTISNNSASGNGGGICLFTPGNGTVELTNSTVSGNSASGNGGGIFHDGPDLIRLRFSTISNNIASGGGGIFNANGTVQLNGTILAKQHAGGDCAGKITSFYGYNLIGEITSDCTFTPSTGDVTGSPDNPIDPVFTVLQDNGGPTWTHGLLLVGDKTKPTEPSKNSPAIDVPTVLCPATDQRGAPRPIDIPGVGNNGTAFCDIGAFERQEGETAVDLTSFTAEPFADHVTLTWQTGTEMDNAGFNLHRATAADGPYTKLNDALIPAEGDPESGASYTYTDTGVVKGVTYYYKLEDVDIHGVGTFHGPVSAMPGRIRWIYLPLVFD